MDRAGDDSPNEAKNSIDNPENAADSSEDGNRRKMHVKKHVQNQIQEANTQMSFKVKLNYVAEILLSCFFMLAHKFNLGKFRLIINI